MRVEGYDRLRGCGRPISVARSRRAEGGAPTELPLRQAKVEPRGRRAGPPPGFTLVELMIVVAIVGILAAIAFPSYQAQVTKSKRAEGKAKLLEMAQSLEKCKALFGAYDATNAGGTPLCNAVTSLTGTNTVPSEGGFYLVSGTVGATTFTLLADPQQDDARCGNLSLDQAGGRDCSGTATDCDATHTPPSDAECW